MTEEWVVDMIIMTFAGHLSGTFVLTKVPITNSLLPEVVLNSIGLLVIMFRVNPNHGGLAGAIIIH